MMRKVIWIMLFMVLIGCQRPGPPSTAQPPNAMGIASFTYSTFEGGIWQVDMTGEKSRLLPDDHTQKWHLSWSPDHSRLAYITRIFEPGGVEENLYVLSTGANQPKKLLGPFTQIQYSWISKSGLLKAWSSQRRLATSPPSGGQPESGKWFQIDVDTGGATEIQVPDEPSPSPLKSPDSEWSLTIEPEGDGMAVYLQDAVGSEVARVYQQPFGRRYFSSHWSPDSRFVAYVLRQDDSSDLYLFPVKEKSSVKVTQYLEDKKLSLITDLQWSPNSQWLLFSLLAQQSASQLCLVHSVNYALRCFDVDEKSNQFVWSTDSRYVAFLAPATDAQLHDIHILEAATGKVQNLTGDGNAQIEDWITAP